MAYGSHNFEFRGGGIPLGNVTSQLFANIYLNELDRFIKHKHKIKFYLRYADDFVILHQNENYLRQLIGKIGNFLIQELRVHLHPDKVFIHKIQQGVDFLGYVCLPYCRILRTKTKKRMFIKIRQRQLELLAGKISNDRFNQTLQSYFGVLLHADAYNLTRSIKRSM